jgi:hypothetical protein
VTTPPKEAHDMRRKRRYRRRQGPDQRDRGNERHDKAMRNEPGWNTHNADRLTGLVNVHDEVANPHRWVPSRVLRRRTNVDFQSRANPEWKSLYAVEGEVPYPLADRARYGEVHPSMLITRTHPKMGTGERCHGVKARLDECTHKSGMRYGV